MTRQDAPYIVLTFVFAIAIFVGGYMFGSSSQPKPVAVTAPTASSTVIVMPVPTVDAEAMAVVKRWQAAQVNDAPKVVAVETLLDAGVKPVVVQQRPVAGVKPVVTPTSHAVTPDHIELEEDTSGIANPYKSKPVASNPGQ